MVSKLSPFYHHIAISCPYSSLFPLLQFRYAPFSHIRPSTDFHIFVTCTLHHHSFAPFHTILFVVPLGTLLTPGHANCLILASTAAGLARFSKPIKYAATPDTCAAAIEVPTTSVSLLFTGRRKSTYPTASPSHHSTPQPTRS